MISVYALLENNLVVNLVEADAHWIANQSGTWVEIPIDPETETYVSVGVGYTYDPTTNTFTPPPVEEV